MVKRIAGWLSSGVVLVMGLTGCASEFEQTPGGAPSERSQSAVPLPVQPEAGWGEIELAVLDALSYDERFKKAARYEADQGRIVVTIFADGQTIPPELVQQYESEAERVSDGIDVVVEVTADGPPMLD